MHSAPPLLALVIIASASCSPYYPRRCVSMPGMAVAPRSGWSSRSRPAVDATRRRRAPTTSSARRRATAATASILAVGRDDGDDDDDDDVGDHIDERGVARALPTCVRRPTSPTRCSSRRAASIVRDCTRDDGLLIITCDASGRGVSYFGHSLYMTEETINLDIFTRHRIHGILSLRHYYYIYHSLASRIVIDSNGTGGIQARRNRVGVARQARSPGTIEYYHRHIRNTISHHRPGRRGGHDGRRRASDGTPEVDIERGRGDLARDEARDARRAAAP